MTLIGRLRGRSGKVGYGAGALGESLTFAMIGTYLTYFYVDEVHLDPALVGLGFMLSYGVWNSINDVIAGYISDRTKTRWGRRIPYILFCTLPMMITFILIWTPPIGGAPLSEPMNIWIFLYFLIIVCVFELMYTFVDVAWNALFPEMYEELTERSEVIIYRQVFAIMGTVLTFVAAPPLIDSFTKRFGTFKGWTLVGITVSLIAGGAFLLSLLGSRERKEFSVKGTLPVKEAFKVTFSNKSFLTAAFLILTTSWVWSLLEALTPFMIVYMCGGTVADIALVGAPSLFLGILFYPMWRKLCIRYGAKKMLTLATVLAVSNLVLFILLADSVLKAIILMGSFGAINGGVQIARELLIPDVIDEDEVKTGFRREGIYYGARTFVDRFALSLTGASTAFIFTLAGFVPGVPQPPEVIFKMRLANVLVLLIALSAFLISAKFYPLDAIRVAEIRAKLKELHRRAE